MDDTKTAAALTKRLNVRLTEDELAQIKADARDKSVSQFARHRLLGLRVEAADNKATSPVSKTDAEVLRELRRIGALIKHVAHTGDRQHVNAALDELRKLAGRIMK